MEHLWSKFQIASVVTITGILYLAEVSSSANEFRRCYNTTDEMHCFDAQYNTTNNRWLTATFDDARQRCNSLNSTLIIIKDQEINDIVQNYMSDPASPIRFQSAWTDANRVSDYSNRYTWHWVNSTLANLPASEVAGTWDSFWYVASLEFRSQFHLTAQQPHFFNSYVCEYEASKCPSSGSNVRQFGGRCYVAVNASVSYYEARNRCLKDSGDLASFSNVASVNFTTWLIPDPNVRYWIGLRNTWYIWKDSGLEVKFSKWILDNDWSALCLVTATCPACGGSMNWRPMDCNTIGSNYVVCHSVMTLHPTTTSISTTSFALTSVGFETPRNNSFHRSESSESASSKHLAIGLGVGLGVGIPIVIAVIVILIYSFARSGKFTESKTARGNNELSTIREPTVAQQTVLADDHYQKLNRNQENSSGTEYAQLGVDPERNIAEYPSNRTQINSEIYEIVNNPM